MEKLEFSQLAKSLKIGEYEHSKSGKRYNALEVGRHSETLEELVIYQALYGEKDIWVRPIKMFLEEVEINCAKVPRFRYIGK
ncbi:MAG: DUF1653 domain-containing protein [Candidatus Jorgensenbacteria bacterium]|nr:DUF1653 domain-containing protein [Candidatus Jorgensenbacteria bacterium]